MCATSYNIGLCVDYCCFLGSQLWTQSATVCWVFASGWHTMVSSTLGGSALPLSLNFMPDPSGREKKTDAWKRKTKQSDQRHVRQRGMWGFSYRIFHSFSSHRHWLVGDLNHFVFQRLKVQEGCNLPWPPLKDWNDPALLMHGVVHLQHLSVRTTHRARKLHNLETREFNNWAKAGRKWCRPLIQSKSINLSMYHGDIMTLKKTISLRNLWKYLPNID